MCKYLIVSENEMDICEYTQKPCTLCVLGNGNTYKEAQEKRAERRESEVAERREGVEESPVDSSTPSVTDSKGDTK